MMISACKTCPTPTAAGAMAVCNSFAGDNLGKNCLATAKFVLAKLGNARYSSNSKAAMRLPKGKHTLAAVSLRGGLS